MYLDIIMHIDKETVLSTVETHSVCSVFTEVKHLAQSHTAAGKHGQKSNKAWVSTVSVGAVTARDSNLSF